MSSADRDGRVAQILRLLPSRDDCPAYWEFDVSFDVTCDLPGGHDLPHRAYVRGNDHVPALVEWPRPGQPKDGVQ